MSPVCSHTGPGAHKDWHLQGGVTVSVGVGGRGAASPLLPYPQTAPPHQWNTRPRPGRKLHL